jgi:predicted SAM-dependent methyltransferase
MQGVSFKPSSDSRTLETSEGASTNAAAVIDAYLREIVAPLQSHGVGLTRTWRRMIPTSIRTRVRCILTDALSLRERRNARMLMRNPHLRVHLGSGDRPKAGWVNVDLLGHRVDLAWNLNRPLPFGDGSVEAIFQEHLLEHLTLERGLALIQDCYRMLKPGGVLRIGVPNADAYVRSYCDGSSEFLETVRPGRPTPMLALQEEFYWHGHQTMYDFDTLSLVCEAAGFARIEPRGFGNTRLSPIPDSDFRSLDTLYVEMVK